MYDCIPDWVKIISQFFTSVIQRKLKYSNMYVTKQFLINIHSKYTRPFHEQHKTDLEGGAKKTHNYRIHPQYFASSKDFDMFVSCL